MSGIPVRKLTAEDEKRIYEKLMEEEPKTTKNFSIEELIDCYRMNGVPYRNEISPIDISKTLLPAGTQEEQAQRRKEALANNDFYTPDYPLFHSIINTLYQNKDGSFKDQIEQARAYLANLIDEKRLITLTRIKYTSNSLDLIVHNYGQDDQYETQVDFTDLNGDITTINNVQGSLQALLDTNQTPQEIAQVYNWFRSKPCYIWRLKGKRENPDERVVGFLADSNWWDFVCDVHVDGSCSSLGVRRAREKIK